MSLERAIYQKRRDFWNAMEAKAVPDTGIDLRRRTVPVKGGFKHERSKVVIDGRLFLKTELVAYRRSLIQKRLDELDAQAKAAAEAQRAKDEEFKRAFEASDVRAYRIGEIKEAVCAHFGITMAELVCERRTRPIVLWRQIAMFLCKELSHRSFPEIGRRFGGRDHSTVLVSCRKIQRLVDEGCESIIGHISAIKTVLESAREARQVESAA